jgi:hypothetical protein
MEVWQYWWGFPTKKATWLAFCGVRPSLLTVPFRLHAQHGDGRTYERLSKRQRAATPRAFAEWLVKAARLTSDNLVTV